MSHNRPAICITSGVYDRRALDCTATVPLINSLTHLAYLTSTSPRIREILVSDGGLERLIQILSSFDLPNDQRHLWKWSLAFQCVVNVGVRGTEQIRTRVVLAGAVHIVMRVLENYLEAVNKARQHHMNRIKRDGYHLVLSPSDQRGYSVLQQPPPPADMIANMLSSSPTITTSCATTTATSLTCTPITTTTDTSTSSSRSGSTTEAEVRIPLPSSTSSNKRVHRVRLASVTGLHRRSTLPYIKVDPAQRRRNRLVRVPTAELDPLRDPRNSSIENLFYREEDILLSLQLLAYLSKYPHIRNVFHSAYKTNVFSLVEQFCSRYVHSSPVQYWAGVIMRNACRKDEARGGIRRCANMQCGRWERHQREFAKCRRCRKAKYCSKTCQSNAWADGHRWWCIERPETTTAAGANTAAAASGGVAGAAAGGGGGRVATATVAEARSRHHLPHFEDNSNTAATEQQQEQQQQQQQQSPAMANPTTSAVVAEEDSVQTVVGATTIL
ncbi:hypothetical protein BX666DRAFT_1875949 [Dichotomocladium elegans]|nr:hypothetical protein BX666DRAFT_1875949 [Dichotomocladium elegans]